MTSHRDQLASLLSSGRDRDLFECVDLIIDCVPESDPEYLTLGLFPAIRHLLDCDEPEVQDAMLAALPDFADALIHSMPETAEQILVSEVLPLVHACFSSDSDEIVECYTSILSRISMDNFLLNEMPVLKQFCHSDNDDVRCTVVDVLETMSKLELDTNKWSSHLLEMMSLLTSDSDPSIREELPIIIGLYAPKIQDQKQIAQLAAKFSLFCRDSDPRVRMRAAEAIVSLSQAVDRMTRLVTIVPAAHLLLSDPREKVRSTITRNLGPLIASIGSSVDSLIVTKYSAAMASCDVNLSFATAYAFPAVALCLGSSRFHEIESGFEAAVNSTEYRIRRTLAFSFCQYASMMDKETLRTVAMSFLRDISSVAIGVVSNLRMLVELVETPSEFLFCLQDPERYSEWRMRFTIARQIRLCLNVFERGALIDIAMTLIGDPVWKVRREAASSLAELLRPCDLDRVFELTKSENRHIRMAVCWTIELLPSELITRNYVQYLSNLCNDVVPNVRLSLAQAVHAHRNLPHLKYIVERLMADLDIDVRNCLQ